MNTLQQLSFLYPNAVTVGVILIALAVIYLAGRALVWAFSSTEKKVEPEPSIMTELDRARAEIAFLKKDREAILRENRRLQVRIEGMEKAAMPAVDITKAYAMQWVTEDKHGGVIGHEKEPMRKEEKWVSDGYWCAITHEDAYHLCGRVPKWSDDEPTPVYE